MKNKITKILKKTLCYAMMMVMVVCFVPLNTLEASAASFTDGKVTDVAVTGKGYNYITLSWSKYSNAQGYQVYRATSKDGDYKRQTTTSDLTFKNKATTNKTYYYKVRAYKKNPGSKTSYSKFSAVITGKATLGKPTISLTLYESKIGLSWNKVTGATGYQIKRATKKSGDYTSIRKTTKTSFENTKIKLRKIYYYKIRAYIKKNDKTYYGPYSTILKARTAIATPKDVALSDAASGLKVSWYNWTNADGYAVFRSTSSSGTFSKIGEPTKNSYTDTSVEEGAKYYYKVRSYITLNGVKYYSGYSKAVNGAKNNGAPIITVTPTEMSVKLAWQSISNITGYEVYRATSPEGTYKKLGVNTKSPTWENDELTLGTLYYYKVRTYKKSGSTTTYGPYSIPIAGRTLVAAPSNIKGSSVSSGIKVTWSKPTNAEGYEITRATSSNGTYSKVGTSSSESFTDTGVTSGKTYYYKIRAYMTLNGERYNGSYSSISATRDAVVTVAIGWLGCKESNGTHKKIIDVYNSNLAPGCGKMNYTAAWCATYVSAVGIKAKATDIIIRHSYCPTMLSKYKSKGQYSTNKSYTPKPGDIIFYDWNKNNTPDHVGMIVSCSGSTVKAIEGNKNDAVGYRTFSKGYTYIQAYALPAYSETGNGFKYTGASTVSASAGGIQTAGYGLPVFNKKSVGAVHLAAAAEPVIAEDALEKAGIDSEEPDGYADLGEEYDAAEEDMAVGCEGETTELEKMKFIIKTVRKEAETDELLQCTESEYYSAFLYKLCDEAGINACIYTEIDESGEKTALVEVTLDGQLYQVDPSTENFKPVEYTPEVTDCKNPE